MVTILLAAAEAGRPADTPAGADSASSTSPMAASMSAEGPTI